MSITGKPGLFKLIRQGHGTLIVEDITTKKRFPAHSRDKVVSLGDIAMYTFEDNVALGEILDKVYEVNKGEKVDVAALVKDGKIRETFAEILPDFDRDRVYDNDIRKLFTWYNLLLEAGFTKFTEEAEEAKEEESETEDAKEEPANT